MSPPRAFAEPSGYAFDDAIRAVMACGASVTYHIANCVRIDYAEHRSKTTAMVRRRLEKMEKAGEVSRVPSPYKTQIAWKHNDNIIPQNCRVTPAGNDKPTAQ